MKVLKRSLLVFTLSLLIVSGMSSCSKKTTGTKPLKSNCGCPHF